MYVSILCVDCYDSIYNHCVNHEAQEFGKYLMAHRLIVMTKSRAHGVHSLLELGTTCVCDLEINTPSMQGFFPFKNDTHTICT